MRQIYGPSRMKTPYANHVFGPEVVQKLQSRIGWLTAGVASSIPWPSTDVCVHYAGDDYILRGSERDGKPSPPGITIACDEGGADESISKIYRFTSILSWFMRGYVDVSGYIWGTHANLYGNPRVVYSMAGIAGIKSFNCNHMPVIEDEKIRLALAFWREGQRLKEVHASYAFLSFYKVIESQFTDASKKVAWITQNIDRLNGRAAERVVELRSKNIDVSRHLFESGRCAVAHATFDREIVDPDIPSDRRRLSADLIIMEDLAHHFISEELGVPDSMSLYSSRNRLDPWNSLLPNETLVALRQGELAEADELQDKQISIGLWPDGIIPGLERMTMHVDGIQNGVVKIAVINDRETILLFFYLDYANGKAHVSLEEGGLIEDTPLNENDVEAYATFFYNALGNGVVELISENLEPVDCEVIIPVNIIPPAPETAIAEAKERFRNSQR